MLYKQDRDRVLRGRQITWNALVRRFRCVITGMEIKNEFSVKSEGEFYGWRVRESVSSAMEYKPDGVFEQ
jgi:hypothetical protein